jgi:O-antigen ligase
MFAKSTDFHPFVFRQGAGKRNDRATEIQCKVLMVEGDFYMFEGVYGNHGVFGLISWIGSISVMMKAKYWINSNRWRLWYLVLFLVYLSIGFLTLSRTIMVIMLFILVYFALNFLRRSNLYTRIAFLFLVLFFTSTSLFRYAREGLLVRSEQEFEVIEGSREISAGFHGRIGRWDQNLSYFFSDFNVLEQLVGTNLFIGPHGDYFVWLFSYGFIGLLLYLGFLIFLFRKSLQYIQIFKKVPFYNYYSKALFSALIAWMIMAVATNPSFIPDFSIFTIGHFSIMFSYSRQFTRMRRLGFRAQQRRINLTMPGI